MNGQKNLINGKRYTVKADASVYLRWKRDFFTSSLDGDNNHYHLLMVKKKRKKFTKAKVVNVDSPVVRTKKQNVGFWAIAGVIVGVAGILSAIFYPEIRNYISSPQERYHNTTFTEGNLKMPLIDTTAISLPYTEGIPMNFSIPADNSLPKIHGILLKNLDNKPYLDLFLGNTLCPLPVNDLKKGMGIPLCNSSYILFGIKDSRLYVSVEFKDLQNEQTIGIIEFNHWKLYNPNLFDYNSTDTSLEVIDKQNNIAFSIYYEEKNLSKLNLVYISGYFIGPRSITILGCSKEPKKRIDTCLSKNKLDWKIIAQEQIAKITPIATLANQNAN